MENLVISELYSFSSNSNSEIMRLTFPGNYSPEEIGNFILALCRKFDFKFTRLPAPVKTYRLGHEDDFHWQFTLTFNGGTRKDKFLNFKNYVSGIAITCREQ